MSAKEMQCMYMQQWLKDYRAAGVNMEEETNASMRQMSFAC